MNVSRIAGGQIFADRLTKGQSWPDFDDLVGGVGQHMTVSQGQRRERTQVREGCSVVGNALAAPASNDARGVRAVRELNEAEGDEGGDWWNMTSSDWALREVSGRPTRVEKLVRYRNTGGKAMYDVGRLH